VSIEREFPLWRIAREAGDLVRVVPSLITLLTPRRSPRSCSPPIFIFIHFPS